MSVQGVIEYSPFKAERYQVVDCSKLTVLFQGIYSRTPNRSQNRIGDVPEEGIQVLCCKIFLLSSIKQLDIQPTSMNWVGSHTL